MEPNADKVKEDIRPVAEEPDIGASASDKEPGTEDEETTAHEQENDSSTVPNRPGELRLAARNLGMATLISVTAFCAPIVGHLLAPITSGILGVILGVFSCVWIVSIIAFVVTLWQFLGLVFKKTPVPLSLALIGLVNFGLIAAMILSPRDYVAGAWFGLVLMILPTSVLLMFRRITNWKAARLAGKISGAGSKTDAIAEALSTAPVIKPATELAHDLFHDAQPAKYCVLDWNVMRKSGECMRSCYRCGSVVFRPEDLGPEDLNRLSEIRKERAAAHRDPRAYRRSDGTYVLGDCSGINYHSVPLPILAAPFFLSGLSLVMAPGFIFPFFNHPIARLVFAGLSLWHLLGCWLFTRTANGALRTIICIVFSMPLLLAPMLGPAVITIWQALGTIH